MHSTENLKTMLSALREELVRSLSVKEIILFGSYATGRQTEESDVDVAVVADEFVGIRYCDRNTLHQIIKENLLRRYADIELHPFKTDDFTQDDPFVQEILRTGKRIYHSGVRAHSLDTLSRAIVTLAEAKPQIEAVYLFGSAAANRLTDTSDVDVGILFTQGRRPDAPQARLAAGGSSKVLTNEQEPSPIALLQLQEEFTDALGIQADVVNLNAASPILRMQVLRNGKRVFTRNEARVHAFFVRTINEYDDLKRARKPIEESIHNGRAYA
jgi:predicted nucleotidyltransferase